MGDSQRPIDLYLISGFLGAGKTSFLRSVLTDLPEVRCGVIVNDFGSVGIDGKVLRDGDLKLVEINNGSIFCACLKGGFIRTLAAFLDQRVDSLFVEASGLADPDNMDVYLDQVEKLAEKKREKERTLSGEVPGDGVPGRTYNYRGGICLVDAVMFEDMSDIFPVLVSQVQKSRFIVINKASDAEPEELEALKEHLKELNPEGFFYETDYGRVPASILRDHLEAEHGVGETLNTPWNRPVTFVADMPMSDEGTVTAFCRAIAPLTLRMKGFAPVDGGILHVDGVGTDISFTAEKDGEGQRPNKLVLIGTAEALTAEAIEETWLPLFGSRPALKQD